MWEKLKQLARRYDEIGELLEVPEIYAEPKKLRALTREQKELSAVVVGDDPPRAARRRRAARRDVYKRQAFATGWLLLRGN